MNSIRRGPYAPHACALCRLKKRKCDGVEPGPCSLCRMKNEKCIWGQPTKQLTSKQVVRSLRNRIDALEKENRRLREATCNCSSTFQLSDSDPETDSIQATSDSRSISSDASEIDDLLVGTKRLVIECDELRLYGPTSAFGLNPIEKHRVTVASSQLLPLVNHGSYVLYSNDPDCWNRYLPQNIISRTEHDHLLHILFKYILSWALRIIPHLFLRDMYRSLSSPNHILTEHYSPMLHNALIALGCSFSDDPMLHDIRTRTVFLNKAKTFLDSECAKPNISAVRALDIIGTCHSTQGQRTLGYMYSGMAGRLCQALGLGVCSNDPTKSEKITEEYLRDRNRTYWSIFCSDVVWSLSVGRDFCLPDPEDDIKAGKVFLPTVSAETDEAHWNRTNVNLRMSDQPCRTMSTFPAICELMRIGRKVMHFVNSGARDEPCHKIITDIDLQLNAWKFSLSPELDITQESRGNALPHLLVMHLAYWWLLCILHRPFYNRRPILCCREELDHVKICDRALQNSISLISVYDKLYSIRYPSAILMQILFTSGSICVLSAIRALSGRRVAEKLLSDSLSQTDECLGYLTTASKSLESAVDMKRILENMMREWVAPRLNIRFKEIENADSGLTKASSLDNEIPSQTCDAPNNDSQMLFWKHEIFNSSQEQQMFTLLQPTDQQLLNQFHSYAYPGISMVSTETLPNQPFAMYDLENTLLHQDFPALCADDFVLGLGCGKMPVCGSSSVQELEDDLQNFLSS